MSEALLFQRGGPGRLWAAIRAEYTPGAVCSCSDGVCSFTAEDTSGVWIFPIPYAADWTVTAVSGSKSKSETVSITQAGQLGSVSLVLQLTLYSPGNECSDITGGWAKYRNASLTKSASYMRIVPTVKYDANSALVGTANKVDLTEVSNLYAEGWNNCGGDEYLGFGVCSDKTGDFSAAVYWSPNQNIKKSLNVTRFNGLYYVRFVVFYGDSYKGDGRIYNVWGD